MTLNRILSSFLILILFSCSNIKKIKSSESSEIIPNEVYIYWIEVNSTSLVNVYCEDIKHKKQVQKIKVNNETDIFRLYKYIQNTDKLKVNKLLEGQRLDSRVLIEFRKDDEIIEEICWSYSNIEKDKVVFFCEVEYCEVEEFLYKNRIIYRFD